MDSNDVVTVVNPDGQAPFVLVCEHASNHIPEWLQGLGLDAEARESHVAWDPGAMAVARHMAQVLDAPLVASAVSRLVYDCNRPPDAPGAMPARSEVFDIPGNADLDQAARDTRTALYYDPFRKTLADTIARSTQPVIVTVHSFTPVYFGQTRAVEVGVLHDTDSRLADAMLDCAAGHCSAVTRRNEPYGVADGVTHTLRAHALPQGHLNVMLEIRNDLVAVPAQQQAMAEMLAAWLIAALSQIDQAQGGSACSA